MAPLRVLLTTDLHGRLTPAQALRLGELRREHHALLFDAGDALPAPNISPWPGSTAVLRGLNEAGCAAMTLGNREFFFRRSGLARKTRAAQFPVLAANLSCPAWGGLPARQAGG